MNLRAESLEHLPGGGGGSKPSKRKTAGRLTAGVEGGRGASIEGGDGA